MKTKVILALFLLLLLISPYFFGIWAENSIRQMHSVLAQDPLISIENTHVTRHWLRSVLTQEVILHPSSFLPDLDGVAEDIQIRLFMVSEINHGPIVAYPNWQRIEQMKLARAAWTSRFYFPVPKELEDLDSIGTAVLSSKVLLHWQGKVDSKWSSPYFEAKLAGSNLDLQWVNTKGRVNFTNWYKKIFYQLGSQKILIESPEQRFLLSKLSSEGNFSKNLSNYWYGHSHSELPFFSWTIANQEHLVLDSIDLQLNKKIYKDMSKFAFTFDIGNLLFKTFPFGPLEMQLSIINADNMAVEQLLDYLWSWMGMSHDFPLGRKQFWQNVKFIFPELLRHGLQVSMPVELAFPSGHADVYLWLTFPAIPNNQEVPELKQLWQRAEGSLLLTIPEKTLRRWVGGLDLGDYRLGLSDRGIPIVSDGKKIEIRSTNEVDETLAKWEKLRVVVLKNHKYEMDLTYKHGKFYLNQKRITSWPLFYQ